MTITMLKTNELNIWWIISIGHPLLTVEVQVINNENTWSMFLMKGDNNDLLFGSLVYALCCRLIVGYKTKGHY